MPDKPNQIKININIPESQKGGSYSNLFNVTLTGGKEIIVDFIFLNPNDRDPQGNQTGTVVSRVILSTEGANALKMLLESQVGKIGKE